MVIKGKRKWKKLMASNDHLSHYYHGKWSPDNISGYN